MDMFDDLLMYEICFPGAITGQTEVNCPYCSELLTVAVDDPMGEQAYQCSGCTGSFEVNWGERQLHYQAGE
jgi:DNA-directed RNA polymerase subunit RPC12/RpoP